jgi:hypothetical protein
MYWPIYHLREPINKAKTMHLIAISWYKRQFQRTAIDNNNENW